jgi:hypothetical protein
MKTTTIRAVRQQQGSWKWQTPYREQTYEAVRAADNNLRWRLICRGLKLTAKKIGNVDGWGGIHNHLVVSDRDAVYSNDNH